MNTIRDRIKNTKGILFDLDGVLYVGDTLIEGACETIEYLRNNNIPCRFTTNTTTRSLDSLHMKLTNLGLPILKKELFSAPTAAICHLQSLGDPTCFLLMAADTKKDFAKFRQSDQSPDYIVVGDIGDDWNYQIMNKLFRMIMAGAEIIALHKGRYWETEQGLQLDSGAFVAGLEYVTGKKAIVTGKPAKTFFRLVLNDLNLPAEQVVMVGDDLYNDILGAQRSGITGVLVRTGKYREGIVRASDVQPDLVVDSISSLRKLI